MDIEELRLHMGELTHEEALVARAAIRWANSQKENMKKQNDGCPAANLLDEAKSLIEIREQQYGDSTESADVVAVMFGALTGITIDAKHVFILQILLKLIRMESSPTNRDHYLDILGYASLMWKEEENKSK